MAPKQLKQLTKISLEECQFFNKLLYTLESMKQYPQISVCSLRGGQNTVERSCTTTPLTTYSKH